MFKSYKVIAINILYTGLPLIHLSRRCSVYDVLISPPDFHDLYFKHKCMQSMYESPWREWQCQVANLKCK